MKSQAPAFDNEDLSWMDLDPPLQGEISQPSGPGESSQNPTVEATHSDAKEGEDDIDDPNDSH